MGRKEDRKLKKLQGEKLGKQRPLTLDDLSIGPLKVGNEMVIPVHSDKIDGDGPLTPEEFSKVTYNLSDKELNRIIYENAKFAVREGLMPDWPEDDFGIVLWFTWNFITDEMRQAFPAIERADYIYIYTSALQHAQYYRAMNIVRSRRKMLYYLGSTNVDECLKQFSVELNR